MLDNDKDTASSGPSLKRICRVCIYVTTEKWRWETEWNRPTHFRLEDFGNTCFNNIRINAAINDSNLKVGSLGLFIRYDPIICLKTVSCQNVSPECSEFENMFLILQTTENIKQKLLVFERKILRRIFGPTQKANGEWRLKTNEELEKAINNENIVRYIKYKRLSWFGHVERMTNERVAKTIYKWKPYAARPKGRPRVR